MPYAAHAAPLPLCSRPASPPPSPAPAPACACLPTCRYGSPWSFSTCEFGDFSGIADAAEVALAAQGVPVDNYRFK